MNKTLFIECGMGAAGDMLMAALLELSENPEDFMKKINSLGLEGVHVTRSQSIKQGICGTHMNVHIHGQEEISGDVDMQAQTCDHQHENCCHDHDHDDHHSHHHGHDDHHDDHDDHDHDHDDHDDHDHDHDDHHDWGHSRHHRHDHCHDHDHSHSGLEEVTGIISHLPVSQKVKDDAAAVYHLIAHGEAAAHGCPVGEVHFHEVGSMDAIADIVGVCLLMEELAPQRVVVSPIHVGSGFVRCAHGLMPVPAPATAYILKGAPVYGGRIKGELCTPTGAALLRHFAGEFGAMPVMATEKIGYGMGKKDFEAPNCVRIFLGHGEETDFSPNGQVVELCCNLDDMNGEALGFAITLLFQNGAHDVFTTPVQMKKNRPGVLLTCICRPEQADFLAALMMKHTTTFGIRKKICSRYVLDRAIATVSTPYGDVRVKTGKGYGVLKSKPEYEDAAAIAMAHDLKLGEVVESVNREYYRHNG